MVSVANPDYMIIAASILTCFGEEQIPKLNYAIAGG
jgi:hypothetical protein